jgi:hypothetical protein
MAAAAALGDPGGTAAKTLDVVRLHVPVIGEGAAAAEVAAPSKE